MSISTVGLFMHEWIKPLLSLTFEVRLFLILSYVGGPISVFFLFTNVRVHLSHSKRLVMFGSIIIGPVFVGLLCFGLVTPLHLLFSTPATQIELVSSISRDFSGNLRGGCSGLVRVASISTPTSERGLCNVPEKMWKRLKVGDRLLLEGMRSPMAFTFNKIELLEK